MPPKSPSRYTIPYNAQLDPAHKGMLDQLAIEAGTSKAALIRELISTRFRMKHAQEFTCSTGANCLCPQMHALNPRPVQTNQELLDSTTNNSDPEARPGLSGM